MEDKYSLNRQRSGIWNCLRDGDFEEEEVWAVFKEKPDYISGIHKPRGKGSSSPLAVPRTLPSAARMIPRTSSGNSSTSSSHETKVLQQSAPLNIPDWSQIYRNKSNKTTPKSVSRFGDYDDIYHSVNDEGDVDGDGVVNYGGGYSDDEEEEEDEYDTKLPPHEFIARRLARSQISSFSVFEGVGRTLKGRDLSKVRNAVLSKTGFLESL